MRWVALILAIFTHQALAQWVQFDVCGFKMPVGDALIPEETHLAPRRGPIYVWLPGITMVVGYKTFKGPPCTKVVTQGHQVFVIGDLEQTLGKINSARGQ